MSSAPIIFVQIASYRDPECQWTVLDLFSKADRPDLITVGICWQYDPDKDKDCFVVPSPRPNQTKTISFLPSETQGVCWARAQAQTLFEGEDYVLMIDSHMRFVKGWDTALIAELSKCKSKKSFLSNYPPGYKPPNNLEPSPQLAIIQSLPFNDKGDIRFASANLSFTPPKPLRGAFVAAGYIFAPGQFIKELPYDPYLYFDHEEITLAARAYTNGWDVYSPTKTFIYHFYLDLKKGETRALHWADQKDWYKFLDRSRDRYNYLLAGIVPKNPDHLKQIDLYGLGTQRTLKEYENFCGLDFKKKIASKKALEALFIKDLDSSLTSFSSMGKTVAFLQTVFKSHAADLIAAGLLFVIFFAANFNTVLNNQYYFGATLFDSTVFQSIIWHSGWQLSRAPVLGGETWYTTHCSPINYIPCAISYLFPNNSISAPIFFFAAYHGFIFSVLALIAYYLFRKLYTGAWSLPLAFISTVIFQLSGAMTSPQWEPRQEMWCPMFLLLFFICWEYSRYRLALLFLILNAAVREDAGIHLALPLFLILLAEKAGMSRVSSKDNPERQRIGYQFCLLSLVLSAVGFATVLICSGHFGVLHDVYYGDNFKQYLTVPVLMQRFVHNLLKVQYLWLPCEILIVGGLLRRDWRIVAGGICFLPYWAFNFCSRLDFNAELGSYKCFPFVLVVLWPALMAIRANTNKSAYILLQMLILLTCTIEINSKSSNWFLHPWSFKQLKAAWILHPEAADSRGYELFGNALHSGKSHLGSVRASCSVISLYPYEFDNWFKSEINKDPEVKYDTLIWFKGDRDADVVKAALSRSTLPYLYQIPGTKMYMLSRYNPSELGNFYPGNCNISLTPIKAISN
jgi:hypothetical protein